MNRTSAAPAVVADIDGRLRLARRAIDHDDLHGGVEQLRRVRQYLDMLPSEGVGEHAYATFAAADRHLGQAERSLEAGESSRGRDTRRALRSLTAATELYR
jgi:hypothetical protein